MKKIVNCLFAALGLMASAVQVNAQCTPDANTPVGITPRDFVDAYAGISYTQIMQFKFPSDTTVSFGGTTTNLKVDSARIDSIVGFPKGFTGVVNKASKTYRPNEAGCATISGNPVASDEGSYTVKVYVLAYAKLFGSPQAIPFSDNLTLSVMDTTSTDTTDTSGTYIAVRYKQPEGFAIKGLNPLNAYSENLQFVVEAKNATFVTLSIVSLAGQEMVAKRVTMLAEKQAVQMDASGLAKGMYMVRMQGPLAGQVVVEKLLVR